MPENNEQILTITTGYLQLTDTFDVPLIQNGSPTKLGTGKCKAVILRLNKYLLDSDQEGDTNLFYFGNAKSQNFEVLRGINSQIIFCTDLEQVFVRILNVSKPTTKNTIRVMVYR